MTHKSSSGEDQKEGGGGERLRGTRRRRGRGRGRGEEDDRRKGEEIFVGRRKWKRNGWKSCDEVYIYVCVRGRWRERKRKILIHQNRKNRQ